MKTINHGQAVKCDAQAQKAEAKPCCEKQAAKRKRVFKKIRNIVIVLAVVGLGIFVLLKYSSYSAQKLLNVAGNNTQVDEIERRDVANTISTTGTIKSNDVRTLTSALAGVTINEVNYEVGDMVEAGSIVVV